MNRRPVVVAAAAETDLAAALHWYREKSPPTAGAFSTELASVLDSLSVSSDRWPKDADDIRRRHLKHFPYTVMFEVLDDRVVVLAIAHQRRRPGYWLPR